MPKDLSVLLSQLNTSGLLNQNPALYQVIKELIQELKTLQTTVNSFSNNSGSGGGSPTQTVIVNNIPLVEIPMGFPGNGSEAEAGDGLIPFPPFNQG